MAIIGGSAHRFLPFADAATAEVPMSRLLRLSLFQVTVGMALVLIIGTLNRARKAQGTFEIGASLEQVNAQIKANEEALKSDPAWGEAANNLASLYHVAGKHERALEIVTEAEKLGAPLHPELRKSIEAALARRP